MERINTLVYFDLEATGLKSSGKPRITEISLVAVSKQDVLDLHENTMNLVKSKKCVEQRMSQYNALMLPRVLNKMTICVYPMATIMPLVSSITGLDNYNLTSQASFDKNTGDLLCNFLDRLPSPVCLVAHNGKLYDFPLLKAELETSGSKLSSSVLCVDSYLGIKDIYKKREEVVFKEENRKKDIEERKFIQKEMDALREILNGGEFDKEIELRSCDNEKDLSKAAFVIATKSYNDLSILYETSATNKNELTPTGSKNKLITSVSPIKMKQLACSSASKPRKQLNFSRPTSFSLINLHLHLFGCYPAKSHGAEEDCLTLLKTTSMLGKEWLDWAENNNFMFSDCVKMWG